MTTQKHIFYEFRFIVMMYLSFYNPLNMHERNSIRKLNKISCYFQFKLLLNRICTFDFEVRARFKDETCENNISQIYSFIN